MSNSTDQQTSNLNQDPSTDGLKRRPYEAPAIRGEETIRQDVLASHSTHINAESFCGCQ